MDITEMVALGMLDPNEPEEPTMALRAITFVSVETSPLRASPDPDGEPELIELWWDLAKPFKDRLDEVLLRMDDYECWNCREAVGYVLIEEDEYPQRSGLRWRYTCFAREGVGPVSVLCEDCEPFVPDDNPNP